MSNERHRIESAAHQASFVAEHGKGQPIRGNKEFHETWGFEHVGGNPNKVKLEHTVKKEGSALAEVWIKVVLHNPDGWNLEGGEKKDATAFDRVHHNDGTVSFIFYDGRGDDHFWTLRRDDAEVTLELEVRPASKEQRWYLIDS